VLPRLSTNVECDSLYYKSSAQKNCYCYKAGSSERPSGMEQLKSTRGRCPMASLK